MTYRTYLGALTGAALFSLAACSTSPDIDGSPSSDLGAQSTPSELTTFTDSHWQVESIKQGGIIDYSNITMNISNNRISGSTGCNRYTGTINVESESDERFTLTTDNIALSRKMCAPALMKQEQQFIGALTETAFYAIDKNTLLTLFDSNKVETVKAINTSGSLSSMQPTPNGPQATNLQQRPVSEKQDRVNTPQPSAKVYDCETPSANTTSLKVNSLGPDTLALTLNNTHHIVQLSRAASGAKYTNNKNVVFWNKGDEATLSVNSGNYYCSLIK